MPRKRKSAVTDDELAVSYGRLRSAQKVALEHGVGVTTVNRALARLGIPRTGLAEYRATMGREKTEPYVGVYKGSDEEILRWYSEGMSMRDIAKRIGRSAHVVARRVRKAGIARPFHASGPEHSMWRGGRLDAGQGYFRVWVAEDDPMASMRNHQGYVLEHRLSMARKLGRPLTDSETVHHIDGDKSNNAPDNLQLRQGRHGKHVVMCCLACGSFNIGHVKLADVKAAD